MTEPTEEESIVWVVAFAMGVVVHSMALEGRGPEKLRELASVGADIATELFRTEASERRANAKDEDGS